MTQEDKELLLKELCARLPYGVKVYNTTFKNPEIQTLFGRISYNEFIMKETYKSVEGDDFQIVKEGIHYSGRLECIKPFLRPMSSMTEEEMNALRKLGVCDDYAFHNNIYDTGILIEEVFVVISWLLERHFDFNYLIEKGLAIEAPENMYKQ